MSYKIYKLPKPCRFDVEVMSVRQTFTYG